MGPTQYGIRGLIKDAGHEFHVIGHTGPASACFPLRVGKALLHTLTLPLVHHFSFIFRRSENRNQAPDPRVSGIAELVHFSYTCVSNTRKAESESCNRLLLNTRCGTSWVQTNLFKRGLGPAARIWVQFRTVPPPREGASSAHQVLILKGHRVLIARQLPLRGSVDYRT